MNPVSKHSSDKHENKTLIHYNKSLDSSRYREVTGEKISSKRFRDDKCNNLLHPAIIWLIYG